MKNSRHTIEQSQRILSPLGHIDVRTQFGGYSLAVEQVVFAVVREDELYLRACEGLQCYVIDKQIPQLIIQKRGMPVALNYFKVTDEIWQDEEQLCSLSQSALEGARHARLSKQREQRLKDLPNLGLSLETQLRQVGISTVQSLRDAGAKSCWLRLKAVNKHLGINTLFALQGAISGYHQAALPEEIRQELQAWYLLALTQGALSDKPSG